jgi:hypothetical protein
MSQTALFADDGDELTPLERKGEYTGERFLKHEPAKAKAVLAMLAAGASIRMIQQKLGIHHRTVAAVRDSQAFELKEFAAELGKRSTLLGADIMAMMQEDMPTVKIETAKDVQHMAISAAKLAEVGQLLTGGATARVESVGGKAKGDEMGDFAETLIEMEGEKSPAS